MDNKCKIDFKKKTVLPCKWLLTYHDEKNICRQSVISDGEGVKDFYTLDTEKIVGRILISFCPFCGEDIGSHVL